MECRVVALNLHEKSEPVSRSSFCRRPEESLSTRLPKGTPEDHIKFWSLKKFGVQKMDQCHCEKDRRIVKSKAPGARYPCRFH